MYTFQVFLINSKLVINCMKTTQNLRPVYQPLTNHFWFTSTSCLESSATSKVLCWYTSRKKKTSSQSTANWTLLELSRFIKDVSLTKMETLTMESLVIEERSSKLWSTLRPNIFRLRTVQIIFRLIGKGLWFLSRTTTKEALTWKATLTTVLVEVWTHAWTKGRPTQVTDRTRILNIHILNHRWLPVLVQILGQVEANLNSKWGILISLKLRLIRIVLNLEILNRRTCMEHILSIYLAVLTLDVKVKISMMWLISQSIIVRGVRVLILKDLEIDLTYEK